MADGNKKKDEVIKEEGEEGKEENAGKGAETTAAVWPQFLIGPSGSSAKNCDKKTQTPENS